jgi:multiple sugar transport system substrate-binding protein
MVGMLRPGLAGCGLVMIVAVGLAGCQGSGAIPKAPPEPFKGVKIEVAAVGDPAILDAVAVERGEWTATRGGELAIRKEAVEPGSLGGADVVLFRGDRLGDLVAAKALDVIPPNELTPARPSTADEEPGEPSQAEPPADPVRFSDVAPAFRDKVSKYGSDRMALPLGGSALVLAYRRDAFEREPNRAEADKQKIALGPPETWTQLDALARFFEGRDWDGDGTNDHGIALALGPDPEGVADAAYLARAAALGQHRDQYSFLFDATSMAPRIDTPPFVEALAATAALKAFGPPDMAAFDAPAARGAFREGKAAMLIDRAERASEWGDKRIGVAPLPGSERIYDPSRNLWEDVSPPNRPSYLPHGGGWLVGVARGSDGRRRAAALDFAKYLIGPEVSNRIRADRAAPMLPVRTSQMGRGLPDPRSAPGVDPKAWSDAVSRTQMAARVVPGLRIPGADGYLADLARGRAAAVGGQPADKALRDVARAWADRTKELGTARQLWHYRRSLASDLATLPEPPET